MPTARPTLAAQNAHSAVAMTERQAQRIRDGSNESTPGDYQPGSASVKRRGQARRAIEERQMLKDLGLL